MSSYGSSYASSTRSSMSSSPSMPIMIRANSVDRSMNVLVHDFSSCTLNKRNNDRPNAYISDEDLFGDSDESPYLSDAPAPPRPAEAFLARPLLPPVTKARRSSSSTTKSSRSGKKHRSSTKG